MRRYAGWAVGVAVVAMIVVFMTRNRGTSSAAGPGRAQPTVGAPKSVAKLDLTKPFPKAAAPTAKLASAAAKAPAVALDLTTPFPKADGDAAVLRPVRWVGPKAPAVALDLTTPFPRAGSPPRVPH